MVQAGEVRGCIGCHEDRLSVPLNQQRQLMAMHQPPVSFIEYSKQSEVFSYTRDIQPIFDRHCIRCHDIGPENETGLVLSGDKNPFFNASYIDLHVKNLIKPIGGGPSDIQQARSWGSHASKLVEVIDAGSQNYKTTREEKEMIYTWLDLNAVYYPSYESAYPENPAGRSPLTHEELKELGKLTGIDFYKLKTHKRDLGSQISFDNPEKSPCLESMKKRSKKYKQALELIYTGQERLNQVPRADMDGFKPSYEQRSALEKYENQQKKEQLFREAIVKGIKRYDSGE